ncbi:hypothetical protein [Ruania alba]|uniref:Uncharacterized protein n=1 Tax=Ruania alba TaxID=648782 RepID=A0A1H5M7F7_9MICO|nr:hypothetical protein [Ruania alba]SEE85429.1 hypothetical protein SAMN04488554_3205 [Ruania alba]
MTTSNGRAMNLTRRQALTVAGGAIAGAAGASTLTALPAGAANPTHGPRDLPELWYCENNMGWGKGIPPDFFSRYDDPDSFAAARRVMDTYMVRMGSYEGQFEGDIPFLEKMATVHHNSNFAFNVTEVVAWWWREYNRTGEVPDGPPVYSATLRHIRQFKEAGIIPTDIAVQSVLSKPGPGRYKGYPMERRIQDVVDFFHQVKPELPDVRIGIIDPLPDHWEDGVHRAEWLQRELQYAGYELSFIHFDKPFDRPRREHVGPAGKMTWERMVAQADFVRDELGITFGLNCTDEIGGNRGNNLWREHVLDGIDQFIRHGGKADRYILTPFHPHPDHTVPDDLGPLPPEGASQMRVLRELGRAAGRR